MTSSITTILLWTAAISSGLMAGVYFAFSSFIMQAFSKIDTNHAIAAMNSINETIVRSLFLPLFFGSSIISVLLISIAALNWEAAGSVLVLMTGVIYFLGMFVCTVVYNVPLNNSLAKTVLDNANAQRAWTNYLKTWTSWNHLRTVSSLVTCILCVGLLVNY